MKKSLLILMALLVFKTGFAQTKSGMRPYWKSASEFIFSMGNVEASGAANQKIDVSPVLRFSGFFHFQEQFHKDFSNTFGLYTGIGVRNMGMINKLNDSITVKQRVYSLGIPLALKLGKLPGGFYIAAGAEAELFFNYKQKVMYDDEKFKKSEWFSDKVNLFNPSVFLDLNSGKGGYIRFKYYLNDFLVTDKQDVKLYGVKYDYKPSQSQMFYVAIGMTIKKTATMPRGKRMKNDTALNF